MSAISRENLVHTATVADNGTESDAVPFKGMAGGGFALPAGVLSTAMTFQVSVDNSTYVVLEDADGAAVSITVQSSRAYPLPAELFGFPWFKFVCGSSETAGPTSISVAMCG